MRARPKNVLICLAVVCLLPFFLLVLFSKSDDSYEQLMEHRYAEIKERLEFTEILNRQRENDLHLLRKQLGYFVQSYFHSNSSNSSLVNLPYEIRNFLRNVSEDAQQSSIHVPSIFTYLPHLAGQPHLLKPSYRLSKERHGVSIVMGIPTIKREGANYLTQTLKSLVEGLDPEEINDCLILVFIAEPWDQKYVSEIGELIKKEFPTYLESGLIEVIAPPAGFYPPLDTLKETFGDDRQRVKWRTKQNLDFSFLMLYASSRGLYYVQMEDDVVAKPGYLNLMKYFAKNQKNGEWLLLEFSNLGFIGKLFRASDIPFIAEFFLMFHADKPVDWLLDHILFVKVCSPEKDQKHCSRMKRDYRRRYKPSLFQHIGTQSSLKGKLQKLTDKDFGKQGIHRVHVNPPAIVMTSLKVYQTYSLHKAYIGETFFWALAPEIGDTVEFKFMEPLVLEKYLFRSGNPDHPGDKFVNTTIEVLPQSAVTNKRLGDDFGFQQVDNGYLIISQFDQKGLAEGTVDERIGKLSSVRLRSVSKGDTWVILSEIYLKPKIKS